MWIFPIDGSNIILDNTDPDTTILPLKFDLDLINSGAAILPTESCDITMSFNDINFYSVFGYLGDYELLLNNGEITLDIFDNKEIEGSLLFADPRFLLSVDNSYGVPVEIELSDVSAWSSINNQADRYCV